jgi:16S rRNA (uracil1498-N3)-methyltransferase
MSQTRLYQPVPLSVDSSLRLDEKAGHHLARVKRANVGDVVVIFNGQGGEYSGVIAHIDKKGVDVNLTSFREADRESPIAIYLAQGMARGEKMDFIVQKAVELGVKGIIPLITERCNVRLAGEREEKKVEHWRSVAISACEQCGRNRVPQVASPVLLREWSENVQADRRFVLSPHVSGRAIVSEGVKSLVLLIGPEGGLSEVEMAWVKEKGFLPLNLGPRVLRTETAAITAVSVLQFQFGDL